MSKKSFYTASRLLQNGKLHIFLHISSYAAEISLHFLIKTRPPDRLLDVIDLLKTAGTKNSANPPQIYQPQLQAQNSQTNDTVEVQTG